MLLGQLVSKIRKETARAHARVWGAFGGQEIRQRLGLSHLGVVCHDGRL